MLKPPSSMSHSVLAVAAPTRVVHPEYDRPGLSVAVQDFDLAAATESLALVALEYGEMSGAAVDAGNL